MYEQALTPSDEKATKRAGKSHNAISIVDLRSDTVTKDVYKRQALESIRTAERLSARGIEAVPVFWLATEDHDLAEVNHSFWLTKEGLERFEAETPPESAGRQVGAIRFGPEINGVVDAAGKRLEGPGLKEVERALREAYTPVSYTHLVSRRRD